MKILITGICGFVGSALAEFLLESGVAVCGIDSLTRPGSESNRLRLRKLGVEFTHGDIRLASDVDSLPRADWVIDAAANPSVLAGLEGSGASRQLMEHNLASQIHILEYCKRHGAGLILLSSSRVYSIPALVSLPLRDKVCDGGEIGPPLAGAFELDDAAPLPGGVSAHGVGPEFSTSAPVSLYGATKLAGEILALEYGEAFDLPMWVNRCGVLAGAGQFGTAGQGIFAFWVNAHLRRRPLKYIGFDGKGKQVRDAFHPRDLGALILAQIGSERKGGQRIYTAGGGSANAMSLAQLNAWCDARFTEHQPHADLNPRTYDIPWIVMDSRDAARDFGWSPKISLLEVLDQIAAHAEQHPQWLELSGL